ncbi:MAG TPA: TerC family protein [Terrimicrobiaceae bacterium]|nr:TerC family protein [Terrimicrobiaceae bacterium]
MDSLTLFPFAQYWWFYGLFTLFVLGMLALDLGVFHRHAHEVKAREALTWSGIWVTLALCFNYLFYQYCLWKFPQDARLTSLPGFDPEAMARTLSLEFLTGFLIEKSLAVDNIFVFVVVFSFFAIPPKYQHRVLFFGIIGALIFRIIFIAAGSVLMQYQFVVWIFGGILILTGLKILFAPQKPRDLSKNPVIRLLKRFARVTPNLEGQRFFLRKNGLLYVTPLFVALVFIEFSDIIFAVDSVPAIFAITNEPLIVFTSNVFAILGLRAMFFLLAGVVDRFRYLKYGLGVVLIFVGLKMTWLNEAFGGKFPIGWSLGIIATVLAVSVGISLLRTRTNRLAGEA